MVSHACVLESNQSIYASLETFAELTLIVPRRWRDELRPRRYPAQRHPNFDGTIVRVPTWGVGRPQRHVALTGAVRALRRARSQFLLVEEEPFSLAALYWTWAARRLGVPYAVQVAENLPRSLPRFFPSMVRRVLAHASFVMARSPAALEQARLWGYTGADSVVAHSVPMILAAKTATPSNVVGFVGRLTSAKGVDDLVAALQAHRQLRLRVAGDGPLRERLSALGDRMEWLGTVTPQEIDSFYETVTVLAVPSRTTPSWSEQFGRVLIEAQAHGTPVVAYRSGEIPWVASLTAVVLVDEGDVAALGAQLASIAAHDDVASDLAERGRRGVAAHFSDQVVAAQLHDLLRSSLTPRATRRDGVAD